MSFLAVKEQKGVTSVNKYWTMGTMLGKIRPGQVNTGMGNSRKDMTEPWSSGFPKGKRGQALPNSLHPGYFKG